MLALMAGPAMAQPISVGSKTLPVNLARVVFDIPPGQVLGIGGAGFFAFHGRS
uniref:Uncharacterized protein n=1 Tax=Phenylobacterium glaciei TaxID=2803784 RepID=A0A974P258_9CAUL|nr:hypothetical protein JKL49_24555 [Phenylobacterium glaciei]